MSQIATIFSPATPSIFAAALFATPTHAIFSFSLAAVDCLAETLLQTPEENRAAPPPADLRNRRRFSFRLFYMIHGAERGSGEKQNITMPRAINLGLRFDLEQT